MTIYPLGPDTYRAEWFVCKTPHSIEAKVRKAGNTWLVDYKGTLPTDAHVVFAAILDAHLDRLANQDPAP